MNIATIITCILIEELLPLYRSLYHRLEQDRGVWSVSQIATGTLTAWPARYCRLLLLKRMPSLHCRHIHHTCPEVLAFPTVASEVSENQEVSHNVRLWMNIPSRHANYLAVHSGNRSRCGMTRTTIRMAPSTAATLRIMRMLHNMEPVSLASWYSVTLY